MQTENPNDIKEFSDLAKIYKLISEVILSYDALIRMENDGAPGMDVDIMNRDHFRPSVEKLVNCWENFLSGIPFEPTTADEHNEKWLNEKEAKS